uniref:ANF_receptor domain-containing protein n=1 Tax=Macrostomum lignano TaxID=282301 RepID=A0A1I8GF75_9PLAT
MQKQTLLLLPLLILLDCPAEVKAEQFRLLCLLPHDSPYQFDHSLVAPSTDLVMDSLTARGLNKHFSLNISFENSTCSNRAALPAMEYYYSGRVDGFLGLACPESCSQVVQYSGERWNKPVVSIGAVEMAFRDSANIQYRHDIFVRVSFDSGELIHSIVKAIFLPNAWRKFFGMFTWSHGYAKNSGNLFMQGFNWVRQRMNMKADYFDTQNRTFTEEEITNTLKQRIASKYSGKNEPEPSESSRSNIEKPNRF